MSGEAAAAAKVWDVRAILAWSKGWFEEKGVDSPRLTAELLLAHVLACPRIKLYVDLDRPLEKAELARYKELVQRRAKGEPVQYLVGTQDFYGRTFLCDRRALIPRPETELVAERALRHLSKDQPARVLDVGCGTGAIGLTIAAERPLAHVTLTDLSPDAAELARENATKLGVSERVSVLVGDLVSHLPDEPFDVIVANLPYVPDGDRDTLAIHIREHEPHQALFSGADGLDHYRRLVPAISHLVKTGGLVVIEHLEGHLESAPALFDRALWSDVTCERDMAGLPRFTWALRIA